MKSLAIALLLISGSTSIAHEIKSGDLVIIHPMVDEANKGQAIADGSVEIRNQGDTAEQLLSITSEFAEKVSIDGTLPVIIPAHGRTSILLRFENIKRTLAEDEVYAGEMVFAKASGIKLDLMVHPHHH